MLGFISSKMVDDRMSISQIADMLFEQIGKIGLDSISPYSGHPGNLALPRKYELCAAVNRYRRLKIK